MHTGTQQKEDALFRVATTRKPVCQRRSSLSLQRQTCKQIFSILVVLISVKETCMPLCIKVGYLVLVLFKCVTPICQENGIYLNFDLFIIYFPIIPKCQLLSHISDWHVTAECGIILPPIFQEAGLLYSIRLCGSSSVDFAQLGFSKTDQKYETKHGELFAVKTLISASSDPQSPEYKMCFGIAFCCWL